MKKIIKGKVYDTDTARELGSDSHSGPRDFHYWRETLYQKRTGEYFLHGEGGPMSRYAVACGLNEWQGGEKFIPLSMDAARAWTEEHLSADDYERIFGLPDEDAEPIMLCLKLPAPLVARLRAGAAEAGHSLTAHIEELLRSALE